MKNNDSKNSVEAVIIRIFSIALKMAPFFSCLIFSIGVMSSISQGVITIQTQRMLDTATKLFIDKSMYAHTVLQCFLLCLAIIISQILNGVHNYVYDLYINIMKNKLGKNLNDKMNRIDPILFEENNFLNIINKAKVGMENSIEVLLVLGDVFTYYIPYFIFMGVYLYKIKPDFLIVLLLVFVPVLMSQLIRMKLYSKLETDSANLRRKMSHYEECVSDVNYIKETRITFSLNYFRKKFMSILKGYNKNITDTAKKSNRYELILDSITLLGYMYILWMLAKALFNSEISIGVFAAVYASISNMFNMMEEILRYNLGNIAENIGTVDNFVKFFNYDTIEISEDKEDYSKEISLNNVTFYYPNQKYPAIDKVSLTIYPKDVIAIVGENGSGKSTLVNIILGLYHPTSGSIEVGKINRDSNVLHYNGISSVFQKFQKYKLNLEDNIRLSDFKNNKEISESIYKANVEELYSKHSNTMLSTEFNGIDLSLGQWQRVAIARSLYKDFELITLDEPSASIDAIEEDALYNKFEMITKDKTSIIVTHHLGSINFAKRIIVMDKGKIVESGTHNELLSLNGVYKKMFVAQSENYLDKSNRD